MFEGDFFTRVDGGTYKPVKHAETQSEDHHQNEGKFSEIIRLDY